LSKTGNYTINFISPVLNIPPSSASLLHFKRDLICFKKLDVNRVYQNEENSIIDLVLNLDLYRF